MYPTHLCIGIIAGIEDITLLFTQAISIQNVSPSRPRPSWNIYRRAVKVMHISFYVNRIVLLELYCILLIIILICFICCIMLYSLRSVKSVAHFILSKYKLYTKWVTLFYGSGGVFLFVYFHLYLYDVTVQQQSYQPFRSCQ